MSAAFEDFLRGHGFIIDRPIPADGRIYRFAHSDSRHDKPCWAIQFETGRGVYGDWRKNGDYEYWADAELVTHKITPDERREIEARKLEAAHRIEAERDQHAIFNLRVWDAIEESTTHCEYLEKKKVGAFGIKIDTQGIAYMPMRDVSGKFWNFQNISVSPKLFRSGRAGGCFHLIEGDRRRIVVTSGYATGASIHEATGLCVVICGGDSNMLTVCRILKDLHWKHLLVAADNDTGKSESGNKIAKRINTELGIPYVIPETPGDFNDIFCAGKDIYGYFFNIIPHFSFDHLNHDRTPIPDDLIAPRILTNAGMLVFGGAPKVGKSDFLLSWMAKMAAGSEFLGMIPGRPLRIFYMQAEIQYDYLRERVQAIDLSEKEYAQCSKNLIITPQLRMLLDEDGVSRVGNTIAHCFKYGPPDIIAIDPISNIYDQESENDNAQMMTFLKSRVEALREYAAPHTAFILVHHTKKIAKDELFKDPFQMFSGASSLRRYYTTGMLMYRTDEEISECVLTYEVRNGERIPNKRVDKDYGKWVEVADEQSRAVKKMEESGSKHRVDRQKRMDTILERLRDDASRNVYHTTAGFSKLYEHKYGLPRSRSIQEMLGVMLAQMSHIIWLDEDTGNILI